MKMKKLMSKIGMDKKNWIFYVISFLLLCFILYTCCSFFFKKNVPLENFASISSNSLLADSNISNTYPRNLILNGNFQNGKRPVNYISQSGTNKIVQSINPTSSGYALEQQKSDTLTYYELQANCEDNNKYLFYVWTSFANKDGSDVNTNIDLSKIINVRVLKTDSTNDIPNLNYNVEQKVSLKDSNITWYLVSYSFQTSSNTDNLMNIYLNYTSSLQTDYQYFCGLALYKVLPEAENFIYNYGLNLFLDGYSNDASSKNWNDLSGSSNNFSWNNIPFINSSNGFINSNGNVLTGVESNKLFGDKDKPFTFIMLINQDVSVDDSEMSGSSDSGDIDNMETSMLLIPGNNGYTMKLNWDGMNRKFICYLPGSDSPIESNSGLTINNKTMITIEYLTKGNVRILQDGNKILNGKGDTFFFSGSDKVKINPDASLNMNFYAILNYMRSVSKDELSQIRNYFITNQDKNMSQTSTSVYQPTSIPSNFYIQDNTSVSSYNRRDKYASLTNNQFSNTYSNQTYMFQTDSKNCVPACNTLCNIYIDDTQKYHECLRSCKNVIPSCKNYCDDSNNKNSIMCETDTCIDSMDPTKDCPIAYKRNENYMVYIKPESYYAKKYNYSGEKSYGKDLNNASKMYQSNFPKCKLPPILTPGEGNNYLNSCPFVIHEANPCFHSACAGVNWDVDNYKDLQMSDRCKKSVSYYCQINSELDDMCACWKPENQDNKKCVEYRKFFENPKDYCKVSQFNIEEHPEINKFIRKDKIPCFGCKVD